VKLPFGMLITSFLIARIILLRYSLSDDRSSRRCPRETDDVNTPLKNVPCQTSIIAYPPRSLWIITDHIVPKELGRGTGSRCVFYCVMSTHEIYDYRFSACDATPDIFIQPLMLIRLSVKMFNIRLLRIRVIYQE